MNKISFDGGGRRGAFSLWITGLATVAILLSGGCERLAPQKGKEIVPTQHIRIGVQDNAFSSVVLIAADKGYCREEGLDVEIRKYPSGKLALNGMFKDEVDFATVADMPVVMNSFDRDDYLIMATIASTSNGAWIIARRDRGIERPEDLKGKHIATQKNSAVHFFLSMFLLHNHISESEVKISYMKAVDLPQALVDGEVDAFSMRNPFITEARNALAGRSIEFFEPNIYRQTFNMVGKKDLIRRNPLMITRLLKSIVNAGDYIKDNRRKAIQTVSSRLEKNRKMEVEQDWDNFNFMISLDQTLLITLENEARWAIKNNLVDKEKIPNYLDFIHVDTLKKVKPDAVTIIQRTGTG